MTRDDAEERPWMASRRSFLVGSGTVVIAGSLAGCGGRERSSGGELEEGAPVNEVVITVEGDTRRIRSNGIPDHPTGMFPNPHCPFPVEAQRYDFRMRREPQLAESFTAIEMWIFGVAVNGVPFDPAGPYYQQWDERWHFEVTSMVASPYLGLDTELAHTQNRGSYHYHGLADRFRVERSPQMVLAGWAADGFPVYAPLAPIVPLDPMSPLAAPRSSYRLRSGERESGPGGRFDGTFVQDYEYVDGLGDLDLANGRFGVTPEYPEGIYHYFLTDDFPFIPRFYRGTPDPSFEHPHPPGTKVVGPLPRELWNYKG